MQRHEMSQQLRLNAERHQNPPCAGWWPPHSDRSALLQQSSWTSRSAGSADRAPRQRSPILLLSQSHCPPHPGHPMKPNWEACLQSQLAVLQLHHRLLQSPQAGQWKMRELEQPVRQARFLSRALLPPTKIRALKSACQHPDALVGLSEQGRPRDRQQDDLQQACSLNCQGQLQEARSPCALPLFRYCSQPWLWSS